jgi:hypothetical protein
MKGDKEKARAASCDAYVPKPYSPLKLLALVKTVPGEDEGLRTQLRRESGGDRLARIPLTGSASETRIRSTAMPALGQFRYA